MRNLNQLINFEIKARLKNKAEVARAKELGILVENDDWVRGRIANDRAIYLTQITFGEESDWFGQIVHEFKIIKKSIKLITPFIDADHREIYEGDLVVHEINATNEQGYTETEYFVWVPIIEQDDYQLTYYPVVEYSSISLEKMQNYKQQILIEAETFKINGHILYQDTGGDYTSEKTLDTVQLIKLINDRYRVNIKER